MPKLIQVQNNNGTNDHAPTNGLGKRKFKLPARLEPIQKKHTEPAAETGIASNSMVSNQSPREIMTNDNASLAAQS